MVPPFVPLTDLKMASYEKVGENRKEFKKEVGEKLKKNVGI